VGQFPQKKGAKGVPKSPVEKPTDPPDRGTFLAKQSFHAKSQKKNQGKKKAKKWATARNVAGGQ